MDSLEKTSNGIDPKEQSRIKRMEDALKFILDQGNHGKYGNWAVEIAREALKDDR